MTARRRVCQADPPAVAPDQRPAAAAPLQVGVPGDPIGHRMEGDGRTHRLLGVERRVLHHHLSPARWRGWLPSIDAGWRSSMDRHRDHRAGISGDAAHARAGRRHRHAAGHRRLGRDRGEERLARGGPRRAGHSFNEALISEFPKGDTWIHGGFGARAGVPVHLDAARGRRRRRDRAGMGHAAAWCAVAALLSAAGLMHTISGLGDTS